MAVQQNKLPELDIDPFSTEFLTDPYPFHAQMRDAGPVVWLPKYEIYAMARFDEVDASLRDWETYSSAAGGGLTNFNKEEPWRKPSIILEADPPLHTRTRGVLNKILNRAAIEKLRAGFETIADEVVEQIVQKGTFDGIKELAEVFPLRVFPDAVGLRKDGRENLLPYGNMAFNAFGPRNALFEESFKKANEVMGWILAQCSRDALSPEGFGAQIYAAADDGDISEEEAGLLVRSLLTAGLDTTVYGIANALFSFASFPDQWQVLRNDPKLIRGAFDEVIRLQSPVQTFFRTTTRDVDVDGITIPKNNKVILFLASGNRDPRKWENPDEFDIQRRAVGHVGFGAGIHICVGQMIARLESEVILNALLKRVRHIEFNGSPERKLNNTLRGFNSLPLKIFE